MRDWTKGQSINPPISKTVMFWSPLLFPGAVGTDQFYEPSAAEGYGAYQSMVCAEIKHVIYVRLCLYGITWSLIVLIIRNVNRLCWQNDEGDDDSRDSGLVLVDAIRFAANYVWPSLCSPELNTFLMKSIRWVTFHESSTLAFSFLLLG